LPLAPFNAATTSLDVACLKKRKKNGRQPGDQEFPQKLFPQGKREKSKNIGGGCGKGKETQNSEIG